MAEYRVYQNIHDKNINLTQDEYNSDDLSDYEESVNTTENSYSSTTQNSFTSSRALKTQKSLSSSPEISRRITPKKQHSPGPSCKTPPTINSTSTWTGLIVIVFAILFSLFIPYKMIMNIMNESHSKIADHHLICNDFLTLNNTYPNQDIALWKKLKTGVESVLFYKPTKPTIFMIVHEPSTYPDKLIQDIVNITYNCLGKIFNQFLYQINLIIFDYSLRKLTTTTTIIY